MSKMSWTTYYDTVDKKIKDIAVHDFYPRNKFQKLLIKLVQSYVLEKNNKHHPGDLIHYGETDYDYEFVTLYYDENLKPICFIKDPNDGKLFGVPMYLCRSPYTR